MAKIYSIGNPIGNPPIYTSNPNDAGLKAYNDSLDLSNWTSWYRGMDENRPIRNIVPTNEAINTPEEAKGYYYYQQSQNYSTL